MESFEQQMLDEIERRYRAYELSKNLNNFNDENNIEGNENEATLNTQQSPVFSQIVSICQYKDRFSL